MKGTEKQIKWAEEIKNNVIDTLKSGIEILKADPRFESTPQANEKIAELEKRIKKLNACDYAGYIIDYFKDIRFTGNINWDFMAVVSNYKITPEDGYNFR